ncbi:MAG: hypothetical protein ACAI44_10775 [Candidatus Sericytochromatia bacterium]
MFPHGKNGKPTKAELKELGAAARRAHQAELAAYQERLAAYQAYRETLDALFAPEACPI